MDLPTEFGSFLTILAVEAARILIPVVLAALLALVARTWAYLQTVLGKQAADQIVFWCRIAVHAAEQSGLAGHLNKVGAEKKAFAIQFVQDALERSGIRGVDVKLIADTIEAMVFEMKREEW